MISCTEGSLYWCSYQLQSSADVLLLAICHCDELKLYFTLLLLYYSPSKEGKKFKTLEKKIVPTPHLLFAGREGGCTRDLRDSPCVRGEQGGLDAGWTATCRGNVPRKP